jgi:hypothetical protein
MNRLLRILPILLGFVIMAGADAQELTVLAVSHRTNESDYTITTPQTSNTNCNAYPLRLIILFRIVKTRNM